MRYGEAFSKLGYKLGAPRQDWSAERDDGICISLWRTEIDWKLLSMDSKINGGPLEEWSKLPGNKTRIRHAHRAINEFDGVVDVVIVDGVPGNGVTNATPWVPSDRKGLRWKITSLDPLTGHIRLEAVA